MKFLRTDALLVVDVQNDFLPGGALEVKLGNTITEAIFTLLKKAKEAGALIAATRDYHPVGHISFKEQGGPWPIHCVQGTHGCEFPAGFPIATISIEVHKGMDITKEAYSGFEGTNLHEQLSLTGIKRIFVLGIATEFCVWSTARDAKNLGYDTYIVQDLIVEVDPSLKAQKIEEFREFGLKTILSKDIEFGYDERKM